MCLTLSLSLFEISYLIYLTRSHRHLWTRRKLKAAFMLNLFTLRGLPWGSSTGGPEKVCFDHLLCTALLVIDEDSMIPYHILLKKLYLTKTSL